MQLLQSLSLASVFFSAATMADFHIVLFESVDDGDQYWLLPSNRYECDALGAYGGVSSKKEPGQNYFRTDNGDNSVCGCSAPFDYYKRSDGHYDFYFAGGDGQVKGTCYWNKGSSFKCKGYGKVQEQLVCYSDICGPA